MKSTETSCVEGGVITEETAVVMNRVFYITWGVTLGVSKKKSGSEAILERLRGVDGFISRYLLDLISDCIAYVVASRTVVRPLASRPLWFSLWRTAVV